MHTLAIANQKGGTGKTTTSVTLAHALAQDGCRVLLVDTDTQGNVADSLGLEKGPGISRLVQWYSDGSVPLLVVNARPNLDIVPSGATTAQAKETLVSVSFREQVLRSALEHLADCYDVAVIDCAPSVDVLHVAALTAADWLVIPTRLEYLAVAGVNGVVHFLQRMSQRSPQTATLFGVLPTFFDRRTNETLEQLDNLLKAFPDRRETERGAGLRPNDLGVRARHSRRRGFRGTRRPPLRRVREIRFQSAEGAMTGRRNPISSDAGAIAEQLRKKRARRKKSLKEQREAKRQAGRHKVTYDVPAGVTDAIKSVAEEEGISASAVAALFLADAARRYSEGQLFLDDVVRRKSSSPRWPRVVDDEYVLAVLRGSQILGGNES